MDSCHLIRTPILHPAGPVALAERDLLLSAVLIMLIVIVPVFAMTFLFVWRYRATGGRGRYTPNWTYSAGVDAVVWLVPAAIVVSLSILLWRETHALDPYRPLPSDREPLQVEAIAQDWKWLFIYPEQDIATVNELVFPAGRPLSIRITSDTVMNAFFIPALGGQIYAMAGMQTRLNLLADRPGCFRGRNMQYSGDGFPEQHFAAHALPTAEFGEWVNRVRQSPARLDKRAYLALAAPSIGHPVGYYSGVAPGLFDHVIAKYAGGHTQ
ncbi:cytochrome bo3 quinol oxidase subunit 2 [Microbulbifer donghaiensis]|uniref:Ubiquinol oxidase subunit 2 n=1 Tax=Microbulbifer donghaiensis TaxID=494016 RepID=A0A1M4VU18_9GAMM|nr:ubiquinol oxidase subunit II [Microbulbifer donghaiensis]SHE72524.1 cytochrome bo3 quinol oxidase subunit 2 [Microbulbifer donghaiensis]